MNLRVLGLVSGLLGSLCWIARWVLDLAGSLDASLGDGLSWAGLVLLGIAFVGYGAGLVSRSALWLRVIVGIAFPALVWSVLEVLHASNPETVDGIFGVVVVVVAVLVFRRSKPPSSKRHAGAHAR